MANLRDLIVNGVTKFIGKVYAQTPPQGTSDTQIATTEFVLDNCYKPPLLSCMWSDHLLSDMSWLRADTFSWQDGNTYSLAYNELLSEYNNSASTAEKEGLIIFKRTPKGYKIAIPSQETAILNKYNSDGIAWYYILDTTNKRFKLPLMKYKYWKKFNSATTLPVKGNGNMLGLYNPNATGSNLGFGITATQYAAYGVTSQVDGNIYAGAPINDVGSNRYVDGVYGVSPDPAKSGLIADSSSLSLSVEEVEFYLYFYVGEFARNSVQQTAGLNSELFNGKLDINGSNLNAQGRSYFSGFGMPSTKFETQTVGASGATYIAPANGWYCGSCAEGGVKLENTSANNFGVHSPKTVWNGGKAYIPCQKGDKIAFKYDGTTKYLTFYYAEGETTSGGTYN